MTDTSSELDREARPAEGLSLAHLLREIPGDVCLEGDAGVMLWGVHHDSRRVGAGDLFVVRRGEKYDGRAFVPQALQRGAVALLAEPDVELPDAVKAGVPIVRTPDVMTALAYSAAAVYGQPGFSLDVIGLTGTNGKTTTTHLVRAAIDGSFGTPYCGVVGTVGHTFAGKTIPAAHTTPEADELARVLAVMRKRGATHVAMEVSSIAIVQKRVAAVRYRVAAFTNLTQDHLDFHGSTEAYAAAKMELFTTMAPGLAVVNVDDAFGETIARAVRCKVVRVRTTPGATDGDLVPERVEASVSGMKMRVRVLGRVLDMETRLVGWHNVENLLVALGTVAALELDVDRAVDALATELGAPGRLDRCDGSDDDIVVLVDYAHTPDALARVLDAIVAVTASGRLWCVFGCGGDRDPTKRAPMGEAVGKRADAAIVTSDNPRTEDPAAIAMPVEEGLRSGGLAREAIAALSRGARGYLVELDRRNAIDLAIASARPGDVVLVAGKGHEDYQVIGTTKRSFDDRLEARAALKRRRNAVRTSRGQAG